MKTAQLAQLLMWAGLAIATPTTWPRAVPSLDAAAFAEAQQRDDTATRAFSNTQIKTSDGKCLFVDELSGDFRANLTPIQVADCGTTDGQGWDVITKGKHNNVANSMLVVSTLTNACFNFDPRRAAGNQVLLFSCGGRADGGGQVTNSQLFSFNGTSGPLSLEPENATGQCLAVKGNVLDIASCGGDGQQFTLDGTASSSSSPSTAETTTTAANTKSAMVNKRKKGQPEPIVASGNSTAAAAAAAAADNGASKGSKGSKGSNSNNNNNNNNNNGKNNKNGTANAEPAAKTNGTAALLPPPPAEAANKNGTAAAAAATATKSGNGAKATAAAKNGKKKNKNNNNNNNNNNNKGKNGDNNNGATASGAAAAAAAKNGTATAATSKGDKNKGKNGGLLAKLGL